MTKIRYLLKCLFEKLCFAYLSTEVKVAIPHLANCDILMSPEIFCFSFLMTALQMGQYDPQMFPMTFSIWSSFVLLFFSFFPVLSNCFLCLFFYSCFVACFINFNIFLNEKKELINRIQKCWTISFIYFCFLLVYYFFLRVNFVVKLKRKMLFLFLFLFFN